MASARSAKTAIEKEKEKKEKELEMAKSAKEELKEKLE